MNPIIIISNKAIFEARVERKLGMEIKKKENGEGHPDHQVTGMPLTGGA